MGDPLNVADLRVNLIGQAADQSAKSSDWVEGNVVLQLDRATGAPQFT